MLRWLLTDFAELERNGITQSPSRILGDAELAAYQAFPSEKRRQDWLLGRWTAKRVVSRLAGHTRPAEDYLRNIQVLRTETGEPSVVFPNRQGLPPVVLSISHAGGKCFVAATDDRTCRIGVDLEPIEMRHHGLVRDFFTEAERETVHSSPDDVTDLVTNLIWCAKEAALKVLGVGLSVSSFSIECLPDLTHFRSGFWQRCDTQVRDLPANSRAKQTVRSNWTVRDGFVLVLSLGESR